MLKRNSKRKRTKDFLKMIKFLQINVRHHTTDPEISVNANKIKPRHIIFQEPTPRHINFKLQKTEHKKF